MIYFVRILLCGLIVMHGPPVEAAGGKLFASRCEFLLRASGNAFSRFLARFINKKLEASGDEDSESWRKLAGIGTPAQKENYGRTEDYVPANKGMRVDETPGFVVSVFNRPHQNGYYQQSSYPVTDGQKFSMGPLRRDPIEQVEHPPADGLRLRVKGDRLPESKGYLHIPFGYVPESYWGPAVRLFDAGRALYYDLQTRDDFVVQVSAAEPFDLSEEERSLLTTVKGSPPLDLYPSAYQEFIQNLQKESRDRSLSTSQIASRVRDFLHQRMKYEVDPNSVRGVLEFCWTGTAQCDGASLVYVTILRTFFRVACEAVAGVNGAFDPSNPGESLVISNATPHMFVAVYDPIERIFKAFDPTPPVPTRPMPNVNPNSPFAHWPRPAGAPLSEAKRPNVDEYWRALFDNLESRFWKTDLHALHRALNERINNQLATDRKAVDDLLRLTEFLGDQRLSTSVRLAVRHPQPKYRYLQLRRLEILAKYGRVHCPSDQKYERLGRTVAKILGFLGREPQTPSDILSSQLPGEFSRRLLAQTGGDRTIFFQLANLFRRIQLERAKAVQSYPSLHFDKSLTPTEDEEIDFEIAEEFEHIESFERQGFPASLDGPRVATGDMLRRVWREPIRNGPAQPVAKRPRREVTILLNDLSGSMAYQHKGYARDRVVQMTIDELFSGGHDGLLIILGYRDDPEKAIYLRTSGEAEAYFRSMMVKREFYESDGENNTAVAFKRAIELIKDLEGEFSAVNLRLLTDGEENLDLELMREVRETVGWETDLNLTAVTLATGNAQLETFIKDSTRHGLVADGVFVHLSVDDINDVISGRAEREEFGLAHLLPAHLEDLTRVPAFIWRELEKIALPGD